MFADKLYKLSDEALLTHYYRTREFKAFRLIYLRHKDRLFRYCAQMSRRHYSGILESLWESLLEQPPQLNGRQLRNWLFIRVNRMMQRGDFNSSHNGAGSGPDSPDPEVPEIETLFHCDPASPQGKLMQAVQQLSRQERNVFLLYVECGVSLAGVADIEQLTLKQCASIYHQSRSNLELYVNGPSQRAWVTRKSRAAMAQAQESPSRPDKRPAATRPAVTGRTCKISEAVSGIEVAAV
ncbi:sigma-70 family RNA polymerase sigma factor [uncultured Microbulbifer sp.]|uniref:RNA polymerase sigma factor n=1 Tax=uncultured Microbulbifer sp. TaxID=348147 RepID=UPI0025CE357B|nr:sigma-70 family RNA polymerase sigma factor [uncultured Microbulbifer sp.]